MSRSRYVSVRLSPNLGSRFQIHSNVLGRYDTSLGISNSRYWTFDTIRQITTSDMETVCDFHRDRGPIFEERSTMMQILKLSCIHIILWFTLLVCSLVGGIISWLNQRYSDFVASNDACWHYSIFKLWYSVMCNHAETIYAQHCTRDMSVVVVPLYDFNPQPYNNEKNVTCETGVQLPAMHTWYIIVQRCSTAICYDATIRAQYYHHRMAKLHRPSNFYPNVEYNSK